MSQAQETTTAKPKSKNTYEIAQLKKLLEIDESQLDQETIRLLKERRKQVADYYYSKGPTYQDKIVFYEELKLLHEYFKYKEVSKPFGNSKGGASKKVRTVEEKKKDIEEMHEFCYNKALDEMGKHYHVVGGADRKDQEILTAVFYKAFVENWTS